jgi:hypothetical protein
LWRVFAVFGIPRILQSDNAPEMVAEVITELVAVCGVDRRLSTEYHPQANAHAERAIGAITTVIVKMLDDTKEVWHRFVGYAALALNTKVRVDVGVTAFELMFNRKHNEFVDFTASTVVESMDDWVRLQAQFLQLVYPSVRDSLVKSRSRLAQCFAKTHRLYDPSRHLKDAKVMILNVRRSSKLDPVYEGPYLVVRRTSGGSYYVKTLDGVLLPRKVPVHHLKLVCSARGGVEVNG